MRVARLVHGVMWLASVGLIAAVTAVLACLLVGCAPTIPGDGALVLVHADDSVANTTLAVTNPDGTLGQLRLGDAVCLGVRYWDEVGARVRCPEDVLPDDPPVAAHLHVVQASALDELFEPASSWYNAVDGKIYAPTDRLAAQNANDMGVEHFTRETYTADFAHETGHAFGLLHEPGTENVMYRAAKWRDTLADDDKAQFYRVTGLPAPEVAHVGP